VNAAAQNQEKRLTPTQGALEGKTSILLIDKTEMETKGKNKQIDET
jgi:hypothetical protein